MLSVCHAKPNASGTGSGLLRNLSGSGASTAASEHDAMATTRSGVTRICADPVVISADSTTAKTVPPLPRWDSSRSDVCGIASSRPQPLSDDRCRPQHPLSAAYFPGPRLASRPSSDVCQTPRTPGDVPTMALAALPDAAPLMNPTGMTPNYRDRGALLVWLFGACCSNGDGSGSKTECVMKDQDTECNIGLPEAAALMPRPALGKASVLKAGGGGKGHMAFSMPQPPLRSHDPEPELEHMRPIAAVVGQKTSSDESETWSEFALPSPTLSSPANHLQKASTNAEANVPWEPSEKEFRESVIKHFRAAGRARLGLDDDGEDWDDMDDDNCLENRRSNITVGGSGTSPGFHHMTTQAFMISEGGFDSNAGDSMMLSFKGIQPPVQQQRNILVRFGLWIYDSPGKAFLLMMLLSIIIMMASIITGQMRPIALLFVFIILLLLLLLWPW